MVPQFKPEAALAFMSKWIANEDWFEYDKECTSPPGATQQAKSAELSRLQAQIARVGGVGWVVCVCGWVGGWVGGWVWEDWFVCMRARGDMYVARTCNRNTHTHTHTHARARARLRLTPLHATPRHSFPRKRSGFRNKWRPELKQGTNGALPFVRSIYLWIMLSIQRRAQ